MKNNLIRGIRKASDFLMALQLTGAFKRDALPNLQARLPAVVIGGGLTAIDTATELMAYYPLQVEKTLDAVRDAGRASSARRASARSTTPRSSRCSTSTCAHGRAVRAERGARRGGGRARRISSRWCGRGAASRIAYRKRMVDSPAYRLNHEEVIKALEEGIAFAENLNPIEAVPDERGAVKAVIFKREGRRSCRPGRTRTDHAAGADGARRGGHDAEHHVREGVPGHVPARREEEVLPAAQRRRRTATAGSTSTPDAERLLHVVRRTTAGSSPTTATTIRATPATSSRRWRRRRTAFRTSCKLFASELATLDPAAQAAARRGVGSGWCSGSTTSWWRVVEDVVRLTPTIVEVIVKAPAAARHFHPGQFYRLQNYESVARRVGRRSPLLMEGIALTGAWVDKERGLLSLIALELGVSSRLVRVPEEGRAGRRDGTDRRADRDSRRPERAAARRRPRQRRAVLDRQGDARRTATA